ncbi:MAG: fluoride efflux transporter CrcB [Bacteroidetes bacterium]|nr:fluoride efflux transporter CrcB [Bacteroidota bacterium]MBK8341983.1 fluoride efflux transporter CrcB [Bacteroidota bacterium]
MQLVLLIGLGGFLGTIARYLTGQLILRQVTPSFPYSTLIVNLFGCFLIGLIYGWFEKQHLATNDWKLMLTAGFCGGFTTFSAFSIENIQLLRDGHFGMSILYIFSSILLGLLLTIGGITLVKSI